MSNRNRLLAGFSTFIFAVSFSPGLIAQEAALRAEAVRQVNSQLTAETKNGLRPTVQTRALLAARQARLQQIFREAPATARDYALPSDTRTALLLADPSFATFLEKDIPLTGELIVSVQDNMRQRTSQTNYSLHTYTGFYDLSFVNKPEKLEALAHRQITVTGLSLTDVVAAESIRGATPAEAEACRIAEPAARASVLNGIRALTVPSFTGPGVTTNAPQACSDFGQQNTAVMIFNMPASAPGATPAQPAMNIQAPFGTQAYYNSLMNPGQTPNIASYMNETSYGQTTFATDVYGPFLLPQAYQCTPTGPLFNALEAATISNGIDVSKYNRLVFIIPTSGCAYDGLGTLPCVAANSNITHEHSEMIYTIDVNYDSSAPIQNPGGIGYNFLVMAHELGHDLGLGHSNSLDFGAGTLGPIDFPLVNPGTLTPDHEAASAQAQVSSSAGSTSVSGINLEYGDPFPIMAGSGFTPYNAQHRYDILGWLPSSGKLDVTTSGSFSVAPTEAASGLRTLHILRDATSDSWLWLEYHQPQSAYTNFGLPLEPAGNNLTSGAELLYSTGSLDGLHTYVLDTTPTSSPNNFADGILQSGLSWSDPYSLLTITPGSKTSGTLPVNVSYDAACATPTLSSSSLLNTAGTGAVTVNATAGCAWSASSNTPWITFTTATSGTGPGAVGFSYTANTTSFQRTGNITTARQTLPILQQGNAVSVVSVTPTASIVAPGAFTPITFRVNNGGGAGSGSFFAIQIGGISPLLAVQTCLVAVSGQGDGSFVIYNGNTGGTTGLIGGSGTDTINACTVDLSQSSATTSGSSATITLAISFPAAFYGNHPIQVSNDFSHVTTAGYVEVTAAPSVTVIPGTTVLSETVTLTAAGTGYQAVVKIANNGTGTAQNVTLTTVALGAANSTPTVPAVVGNIAPGGFLNSVFTFPLTAGAYGTAAVLRLAGTYAGGNFAGSIRVTLPPHP